MSDGKWGAIQTLRLDPDAGSTRLFVLDGSGMVDRHSMIMSLAAQLPTDPPVETSRSWDGISDSIYSGLRECEESTLMLVLIHSEIPISSCIHDLQRWREVVGYLQGDLTTTLVYHELK